MKIECPTCKGAGAVWARWLAFPIGFRRFVGSFLNTLHEDGEHREIVCPGCNGKGSIDR